MYSRSFQDPDGHLWEVLYVDMSAMSQKPIDLSLGAWPEALQPIP